MLRAEPQPGTQMPRPSPTVRGMTDQTASEQLLTITTPAPGVAVVTMSRESALNAVNTDMAVALTDAAAQLAADNTVHCVVLASSHTKAFCVGADLKERNSLSTDELRLQRPVAREAYRSIAMLPVPTVAAVEGYALGGGFELALSCDIIVAGQDAVLGLPEVSVGVVPGGGGTQTLVRRVGYGRACEVIFSAQKYPAEQALAMGAVNQVVPTGEATQVATDLAATIAGHSPVGLREAKRAVRQGMHTDLATGLDIEDGAWRTAAFSGDRAEGVAAWVEKRRPEWPGK